MPRVQKPIDQKPLEDVVDAVGLYPLEAYEFVRQGLGYTVRKVHGEEPSQPTSRPGVSRHVSGQQLCHGLREYALLKWGLLARTVLGRWNVRRTLDFGRIVFAMVENGWMARTDADSLEDFREVFDFLKTFESGYQIEMKA